MELANDVDAGTRRNELAAAVIAGADTDPEHLLEPVLAYRRAPVRGVVLAVPEDGNIIELPRYGPRRRSAKA